MLTDALVVSKPGAPFKFQKIEVNNNLHDNEVLIRMKATGVCHTDLNFSNETSIPGLFPAVFGHEGAGTVVSIGSSVTTLSPGDNVLTSYTSCGNCSNCDSGHTSFCRDWEHDNFGVGRSDGSKAYASTSGEAVTSHFFGQSSFARHAVVMKRSVIKVPADAPLQLLAPLGCGIMTGAGAMLNVVKPTSTSIVAVVGAGAVGLAAIMALKLNKEQPKMVIAVDLIEARLDMAKKYGATHVINSAEVKDLKAALLELTDGEGVNGSIDCTGRADVVNALMEATAKRGTVVSVGVGKLDATISANIFNTVNSGRIYTGCCMGSCYPQEFIPMIVEAWKRGDFPFTELIKIYPAHEMDKAVKAVLDGSVVKAVLTWE
ncbi:hypothetical protein VE03_10074 [Pseudogymnoascus sp. 23342-1-I1]|nr:hypothetical protein VE03_10074 [Pseudogymnoascus sp. 23342-1-I1]